MDISPTLVIHGGAWAISDEEIDEIKKGLGSALQVGKGLLEKNYSALDVVEAAIKNMEDSGAFGAGKGSALNEKGEVEMDAAIMDDKLNAGAVGAIRNFQNPILIARKVMEKTPHVLLVGEGAEMFAEKQGFQKIPPEQLISARELKLWKDGKEQKFGTVGAVAIDSAGNLAAGTSTGGTRRKMVGRVGDSPIPGAGAYCDFETGAASATGHGESFIKILACKTACDFLKTEPSAQSAAEKTIAILKKRNLDHGGIILLRKNGDIGIAFNTPRMARAYFENGKSSVEV